MIFVGQTLTKIPSSKGPESTNQDAISIVKKDIHMCARETPEGLESINNNN